ncbi:hypothetical protein LCGC14_1373990 [marine sediment metagenome]|uniref:Uncharacterized protein n=1 Tax=marine sediment metagenome TaxID=412755 RepID=A0A0F9K4L4_9ZZZZ
MPKYRVKPGRSHTGFKVVDGVRVRHKFGSGEVVELTENSAMAFADCFDLVEEPKKRSGDEKKSGGKKGGGKKKASAKAAT